MIKFYRADEKPYGVFSNYYVRTQEVDGTTYASNEHYFQSEKFEDDWYCEKIMSVKTPNMARELAHQKIKEGYAWRNALNPTIQESLDRNVRIRADWDRIKEDVMRKGLVAKFGQNEDLRALLVGTGDAVLVEDSPYDSYWGVGRDGKGRNRLGVLLMEVRELLRSSQDVRSE